MLTAMRHLLPPVLAATLLGACSSAPIPMAPPDPGAAATLSLAEYPGAPDPTTAFDARAESNAWHSDDQVVFALRLRKGDEVHRWLLKLEVVFEQHMIARLEDGSKTAIGLWQEGAWQYTVTENGVPVHKTITSPVLPVAVTVADEQGEPFAKSMVRLPSRLLGGGILRGIDASLAFTAAADATAQPAQPAAVPDLAPYIESMLGVISLLNVVQEDDALADYFWQVVEKPSIWSLVTNFGAKTTLSMPFEASVPATSLPAHLPDPGRAFVVPLRIDVNGSPALLADVVAVDSSRPYALCGGMVAAVARHPSKPDVTFEVQLLSAKLGKPKPEAELKAEITLPLSPP